MSTMSAAEFVLSVVVAAFFWRRGLQYRFLATSAYLALRVASAPVLFLLLSGNLHFHSFAWSMAYFLTFWAVYIASAVLLFFICIEVFRSALAAFPGLMRFGVVIFRWAALASLILTFSTVSFAHRGVLSIPDIGYALMRSVSILELSLLAFLCLSMNAIHLSPRNVAFGIALGFGLLSTNDFIFATLVSRNTSLTSPLQFVYESLTLLALGVWATYCLLPEPVHQPVVMPVNSTIYRWNEIASALGHTGTQVAMQQPANGFFLTDVEKVVEKVLNRNLQSHELES